MTRVPRWLWRCVFWGYAVVLFGATHWPKLAIEGPVARPDLYIHVVAFGLWTVFFAAAGYTRRPVWVLLIAAAYSAFDEGTQAIPFLHRHASWDDFGANIVGVLLGLAAAAVLRLHNPETDRGGSPNPRESDDTSEPNGVNGR